MDHALSYVYTQHKKMIGGDSLYNRMSASHQLFRESQDTEFEYKVKKVSDRMSESMNIIANEPSLAFFRVQEHVRKSLPQLVEQKHEVEDIQQSVQGACFDTEYAANTVRSMQKSTVHFQNVQDLLKNAMFMKQQIDYKEDKKEQEKTRPTMYRAASDVKSNASATDGNEKPFEPNEENVEAVGVDGPALTPNQNIVSIN